MDNPTADNGCFNADLRDVDDDGNRDGNGDGDAVDDASLLPPDLNSVQSNPNCPSDHPSSPTYPHILFNQNIFY